MTSRMRCPRIAPLARGILLLLISAPLAHADEAPTERSAGRQLADHLFTPSEIVQEPFVLSFARKISGIGYTQFTGVRLDSNGAPTNATRHYHQYLIAPAVSAQIQLLDWLAVRGTGNSQVFIPADSDSALGFGVTAQANFGIGASASTQFTDNFRGAALVDVSYGPASNLSPLAPIAASARQGKFDPTGLYEDTHAFTASPALSAALGLGPLFGFVSSLQLFFPTGPTAGTSIDHNALAFAVMLDFNVAAVTSFPFAVTGGYRLTAPFEGDKTVWHQVDVALLYNGRREFVPGVELGARWFPQHGLDDTVAGLVDLILRYYY
jgi:hypothetical protein